MPLPPLDHITYGPVRSRRLGASLGINLLPAGLKVCNMNCSYCQYGRTPASAHRHRRAAAWPTAQAVELAVSDRLYRAASNEELIDRITIAGHGEPTLHPEFEEIVGRLCAVRDRIAPAIPIAVLSNSTTCGYSDVRDGLRRADERYMKLDGGDPFTLREINGTGTPIATIVDGLMALRPVTVQAMFVEDASGHVNNVSDRVVNEWLMAVEQVRAERVHVYTIDRAPAHSTLRPVAVRRLREIAACVRAVGIPADVFAGRYAIDATRKDCNDGRR
jgi:wyosine [tRNA(Phe)-imidazoG37] synthetase (radical SAM superfamily)